MLEPVVDQPFGSWPDFIVNHPEFGEAFQKRDFAEGSKELLVADQTDHTFPFQQLLQQASFSAISEREGVQLFH